jgi:hypothetical protein
MAKNNYRVFFPQMGDDDGITASGVEVVNGGELVVACSLPREASYDEMMQVRRAISDDKPSSLVREIVFGWVQQLSLLRGAK